MELQALNWLATALRHADMDGLVQQAVCECVHSVKVLSLEVKCGSDGGKDTECSGSKGGSIKVVTWMRLLQVPSYTDAGLVLLQKSLWAKLVGENPLKRKKFCVSQLGHNREGSLALEIVVLLSGILEKPLSLTMALQLFPVSRRRRQIVSVLPAWALVQAD
jgi:hypothetical protein